MNCCKLTSSLFSKFVVTGLLGVFVFSCQNEEEPLKQLDDPLVYLGEKDKQGMIKLGKQLENPYSVETMKKAWENVKQIQNQTKSWTNEEEIDIITTHLYIRFKPKNEDELAVLKQDSSLILYTYPLDYEIETEGDFYHDPEIPLGVPTYQYVSVQLEQQLPNVEYELLSELYIPEEDSTYNEEVTNGRIASNWMQDLLIKEALRLTNNLDNMDESNANARKSKWRPAGRITVWDDRISTWSAVEGIEVRARRWFTTHTGITDNQGNYSCDGEFREEANYSIQWDRHEYSIRSGGIGQAILNGPKQSGNWNVSIQDNDLQQFYAFIHLGAYHYYYGNILGLKRPPRNSTWQPQMKIGAFDKDGRANHNDDRRLLGIRNQIKIYRIESGGIAGSERMYNTTLHELAHASHWELRKGDWDNGTQDRLQESWAMGVAWSLTRLRYPDHDWWADISFQWMRTSGQSEYTSLIIDLIDSNNQGLGDIERPLDRVEGYTIAEIESVLANSGNIETLRDNLRNRYNNPTEGFLDELFTQYINLAR